MSDPTPLNMDATRKTLTQLGFYGLAAQVEVFLHQPWLVQLIEIEQAERQRRSLKRRLDEARLGSFKPLADFDWHWPTQCDRPLIEDTFTLGFIQEAANVVFIGGNGLGKTMLAKNLVYQAVLQGYTARFTTASDMLHDLAAQESSSALARRLRGYTRPQILAIDEIGYLSYDTRYADLLFEVVSRRYQQQPIILTTNKVFTEWNTVFPNAACVVTLIDRLVHRAEILKIEGDSYRVKEAQERAAQKATARKAKKAKLKDERGS